MVFGTCPESNAQPGGKTSGRPPCGRETPPKATFWRELAQLIWWPSGFELAQRYFPKASDLSSVRFQPPELGDREADKSSVQAVSEGRVRARYQRWKGKKRRHWRTRCRPPSRASAPIDPRTQRRRPANEDGAGIIRQRRESPGASATTQARQRCCRGVHWSAARGAGAG